METRRAGGTAGDRFHVGMMHSPIGMAVIAADGRFVEVNDALCRMLGRSAEQLLAATWQDLTHPDDLQADVELVGQVLVGERDAYKLRKRYLRPDGGIVHGDLAVVAVRDGNGEVEFFISQIADLTEVVQLQDRYRLIAENVNDVVAMGDNEGIIQWVSESARANSGWEPRDLEGTAFRELVHPDDLQAVGVAQAGLAAGESQQLEVRLRMGNGDYRWMNLRIRPVYDDAGTMIGRVGGWWDQDEHHRAIERISEVDARYRAWLAAELDAHLFLEAVRDREGQIIDFVLIDVNAAALDYMRLPVKELVGRRLLELFPGFADVEAWNWYCQCVDTGEPLVRNAVPLVSQVQLTHRLFNLRGIKVGDGLSLAFRDVTDKALAHERLAESERRYRLLADNSADTVLLASEGIMRWLSPSLEQLLGCTPEEWVEHRFEEFTHPEDVATAQARRAEINAGGSRYTRLRMRHKDGSYHWIDINAGPVAGGGIVASLRAADELVRIEQALAESKAQALALAAKYEVARDEALAASLAKTSFLSRMSHELRTPLNAVLGFAQLLAMDPLSPDQQDAVGHIRAGGRHLLDLINEILDISRIEAGRLSMSIEPILVMEVVAESLDLVRPLAEASGITLRASAPDCDHWVRGDRQRVIQILINLLSNAIKYTPGGGSVTVTCDRTVDESVRIAVTDTGPGISPEKQRLLFHAFERLGAETSGIEGTGVGLTLSLGLAEAMQGTIDVESTVGAGSTFTLVLPASAAERVESRVVRATPVSVATARPVRVLYIEDNLANARLMARICELRDHAVLDVAATGREGLTKAATSRPDLILLDLHLPDMYGEEVVRELRTSDTTDDSRIVIVTADATTAARSAARQLGADGFIAKPIEVSDVLAWLDDPERAGGFGE